MSELSNRTLLKSCAVTMLVLMLVATIYVPVASASSGTEPNLQWLVDKKNYKEAKVTVDGEEYYLTVKRCGELLWEIDSINGVEQHTNYITATTISRPPYPWWIPMGNVLALRMFLDPATATNTGTAIAAIVVLCTVAAAWGNPFAVAAAAVSAIVYVGYSTLYGDHHPNGSWSLWVPVDWYNYLVILSAGVYMATCRWWWYGIFYAIPWKITTHSYWS